jgi:sec-independent protein translocase protein TatC
MTDAAPSTPPPATEGAAAPTTAKRSRSPDGRMSFFDHLNELRRRLLYILAVLGISMLFTMAFSPELFEWFRYPLLGIPHQKLIVLSPFELYITYIKLALLASLFITAPFMLLQIWLFIAPGLYPKEKRWIGPFVVSGSVFFITGGAFAFFVVLPFGLRYIVELMPSSVEATFSVELYVGLVVELMLAFGAIFELPLVMWILSAVGLVNPRTYRKIWRYWVVVAFIIAAVLTPTPDPLNQLLMAGPLLVFYEIGALGARIMYSRRHREDLQATAPAASS